MSDPSQATEPTRLVVETLHHDLVHKVLSDLKLTLLGQPEDNEELGLTRLTVTRSAHPVGDADWLVLELRRRLAARFGGWVPALGKDREAPAEAMRRSGTRIAMGTGFEQTSDVDDAPVNLHPAGESRMSLHPGIRLLAPRDSATPVRIGLIDVPALDRPVELDPQTAGVSAHSVFTQSLIKKVAPAAQVELRGVLAADDHSTTTWDVVTAMIDLAVNWKADIIAMPLGGFTADGQPPLLYARAMARIQEHSMVIAAAGNHVALSGWDDGVADTSAVWPAALPGVIAVGGKGLPRSADLQAADDTQLPGVNDGEQLPWVDVVTSVYEFSVPWPPDGHNQPAGSKAKVARSWKGAGTSFCAVYAAAAVAARMGDGLSAGEAWDSLLSSDPSRS